MNEVKKSLAVDGYLKITIRYANNKQATNLYSIETDFMSVFVNLKGKGDQNIPAGIPAPIPQTGYRDSGMEGAGIPATEVLTNEVLNFNNKSQSEKFDFWAKRTFESKNVKTMYVNVRKLNADNFSKDFEAWYTEAKEAPEEYETYRAVYQHFLNYASKKAEREKKAANNYGQAANKFQQPNNNTNPKIPRYT